MSSKLLNSFFDGSPLLKKLKDTLCERDSILEPGFMTASNVLVKNNEVIQLVVSCDGISTTLDIIIPEIAVKELITNTIEQVKSKNECIDKSTSCHLITTDVVESKNEYFDKSTSCLLITEQNCQGSQEALKETVVSCPDSCNCDDCPFLKDEVPTLKVIMKESEAALNPKESVLSILHTSMSRTPLDANKRTSFLKITSCMPIRDSKLVLHWKVESYTGIIGYRIFIDGNLKSTVHSPRRTCSLISDVNLKKNHLISISIIPDQNCPLSKNIVDTLEQFYYQPINLN